ncbi:zinc knuckle CX2CX4HX4C containing protein [Tanacetum coccineum]
MERMEPKKLLVWVKIVNVPLQAWSIEGISALASNLGKPVIMDTMTTNMCYKGVGNFEYARVLVEIDAEKIDIKGSKKLKVVYDWKPPACTKCIWKAKATGYFILNAFDFIPGFGLAITAGARALFSAVAISRHNFSNSRVIEIQFFSIT